MENSQRTTVFVIVGSIAFLAICAIFGYVNSNNKYTMLENRAVAQQDVSKVVFDNTWKVIKQQADVADKERESFRAVFTELIEARTSKDSNLLMKWSQEAQIPINNELFKTVQNSIDSQRSKFTAAQKELISVRQEANTLKNTWPHSMYLSGRKTVDIKLVTSSKTEEAFETGREEL